MYRRPVITLIIVTLLFGLVSVLNGSRALASGKLTAAPDSLQLTLQTGFKPYETVEVTGATGPLQASVDKSYMTAAVAGNTVTVTVDGTVLDVGFTDVATITISDGTDSVQVPFSVTVGPSGFGCVFSVTQSQLDFGTLAPGTTKTLPLDVTANTDDAATGTVYATQPWISVTPVTLSAKEQTLEVTVNTERLSPGATATGEVRVDAGPGGMLQVPVRLAVATSAPVEQAAKSPFKDVPDSHWALQAITAMQQLKVINGYADGTFRPNNQVTREQFAKMMVAALQLPLVRPEVPTFPDVPKDAWSFPYVETARPYLGGYADGYRPGQAATREQITAALVMATGLDKGPAPDPAELDSLFTDAAAVTSPGHKILIVRAVKAGLISGFADRTFRPQESLTRAQAAVLLYRALTVVLPAVGK